MEEVEQFDDISLEELAEGINSTVNRKMQNQRSFSLE
jgi:hypothetical protein